MVEVVTYLVQPDMPHAPYPDSDAPEREHQEELIDESEEESFPASDPPERSDFS